MRFFLSELLSLADRWLLAWRQPLRDEASERVMDARASDYEIYYWNPSCGPWY